MYQPIKFLWSIDFSSFQKILIESQHSNVSINH